MSVPSPIHRQPLRARAGRLIAGSIAGGALSAAALAGCSAAPAAPAATVTVTVAAAAQPAEYEVQLHRAGGSYRSVHRIASGQTRTYAVPSGWLTVRIPGLCIVPTPNTGSTVVHVDSRHCTLA